MRLSVTATCSVAGCVSATTPTVGPALLAIRRLKVAVALVAFLLCLAFLAMGPPPRVGRAVYSWWFRGFLFALGIRVRVRGPRGSWHDGPELVVANHVSWLDSGLIQLWRPGQTLVKSDGDDVPAIVRRPLRVLGTVFFDRERPEQLPRTIGEITGILRGGGRFVCFPEGTTYCGEHAGAFRPALFQAAVNAGAPVRPVRVDYVLSDGSPATAAAFIGDDNLTTWTRRVMAVRGVTAEIAFLPPLPAAGGRQTLARLSEDSVRAVRNEETTQ